ncbi:MAG: hypothetical protein GH152_00665 [Dehalococcoidia bacterium]|nr:hypothetical protein [Dehalococcoidia bacterium]
MNPAADIIQILLFFWLTVPFLYCPVDTAGSGLVPDRGGDEPRHYDYPFATLRATKRGGHCQPFTLCHCGEPKAKQSLNRLFNFDSLFNFSHLSNLKF